MSNKKTRDFSKSNDENIDNEFNSGIAGKSLNEPIPTYEPVQSENIIEGPNNSFIIQGRDRPGSAYSGYGGRGATQAGRIDLIVGLGSSHKNSNGVYGPPDSDVLVNPNFAMDAARVYISQKSDIDKYMGLAEVPRQSPGGRSAIGLKADAIRIHARNDIKLVTGRARYTGLGRDGERLANGGINETVGTISFIAGNYTKDEEVMSFNILDTLSRDKSSKNKLQPVPKGDALAGCLEEIINKIQELSSLVGNNTSMIQKMNTHLINPINHFATAPGAPTTFNTGTYVLAAAPFVAAKIVANQTARKLQGKALESLKINYLNEDFGSRYINSKYVYTT